VRITGIVLSQFISFHNSVIKVVFSALLLIFLFNFPPHLQAQSISGENGFRLAISRSISNGLSDTIDTPKSGYIGKPKIYLVRTPPVFTLQFTGSFNLGFAELSSNYADVFDAQQFQIGENFGVRYGFGVYATGKYTINEKGNLRLISSTAFSHFSSELLSKQSPFGKVKYNLFSFGLGIENSFNPKFRLKPYVSFELDFNMISGSATIIDTVTTNVKIKNSFRIGYSICAGFEYLINNNWGFTLGARVTNANQILKQSKDDGTAEEIHLRDKRVNPKIFLSGFKNFVFVSFYAGVNLFFGIKEKWFQIK